MKTKQFLTISMAALLACSAAALGACGDGNGDGGSITEPPTTDESTWHSLENNSLVRVKFAGRDLDTERINYEKFVEEFNESHSNIVVTLDWTSDGDAYNTQLNGMGNNLPDVFMLSNINGMFTSYAASGKLANLRDHIDEDTFSDLYKDGYDIYYFDHGTKRHGYSENAAFYGLPKDMGPYALAVNEKLLKTAVDAYNAQYASEPLERTYEEILSPTNPMNYEEFLSIGSKLKKVLSSKQYVLAGYNMESTVYSNNADFYKREENGWKQTITSENFVGAMQFYQNLYKNGILPEAGKESSADTTFTSGRGIFYYVGPWTTKDWWNSCEFAWNIVPVIAGTAEGAISTAYVGGMCYAISNNSDYKDAALEFAQFLATRTSSQRTQYSRGQCIPNLKSLATEYSTDALGLIKNQSGKETPYPANRCVWVDAVDGAGTTKTDANGVTYTDKISGRYSACAYTTSTQWLTEFTNYIGGSINQSITLWKPVGGEWLDPATVLEGYTETLQANLDTMWRRFTRN